VPVIAGGVLLAFSLGSFAAGLLGAGLHPVVGWLPLPVMAVLTAYACRRAGRHTELAEPTRRFWRHLSMCVGVLAVTVVLHAYDAVSGPPPHQRISPATTALYLLILLVTVWALMRLPAEARSRGDWTRFGFDAGIILITSGILVWHFALSRAEAWTAQTGSAAPMLGIIMIASVSLIAFVKVAFTGAGGLDRGAVHLLSLGTALAAATGSVMPFLGNHPQLNSAFLAVPIACFGAQLAAGRQLRAPAGGTVTRRARRRISVVPYLAVAGMDAMLLSTDIPSSEGRLIAAATVAITALVVLRQITAQRENGRLLATVDTHLSQLRAYQEQLAHQLRHDSLTEIANRPNFEEQVTGRLAVAPDFLVALLDLDDFKTVNDRLGHGTGDALLKAVSRRLHERLRAGDTVARLGGDEFTLLLPGLSAAEATGLLQRVIAGVQETLHIDGHEMTPRISIGLTAAQPGDTPGELLRRADVAMYAAKHAGGGRWAWFDPAMDRLADRDARLGADLRQAAARGELSVVYQPIVELPDGRLAGVEALVRWHHPEHGQVSPAVFIPLAERNGAIIELGRWILGQVATQAAEWERTLGPRAPRRISVNVSPRELHEPGFVAGVAALLAAAGVDPARITAEITETAVLGTGPGGLDTVRELHELGLQVALDDFGTGQSSLSLLVDCPVHVLKVDKSFVDGVTAGTAKAVIVDSLIAITTGLGIQAVAEGVETEAQARRLHAAGYRYAQGFHFARPMPADDISRLLSPVVLAS
jgi:diguanylate cyclase (GGDEF)-like protein